MNIRKQNGGTLLGLFIGLVIGVVIAAGVVWYLNKTPPPFQEKVSRPAGPATPTTPEPLPGKPGEKVTEKPRFEFYKILPGTQDSVPQNASTPAATPTTTTASKTASDSLFLQAGAFQKPADADNLKARLALMGIEATIQQANLPDKGTLYRVRTGPYANPDEMAKTRSLLVQNGIQASVVKTKDGKDAVN